MGVILGVMCAELLDPEFEIITESNSPIAGACLVDSIMISPPSYVFDSPSEGYIYFSNGNGGQDHFIVDGELIQDPMDALASALTGKGVSVVDTCSEVMVLDSAIIVGGALGVDSILPYKVYIMFQVESGLKGLSVR